MYFDSWMSLGRAFGLGISVVGGASGSAKEV